MSSSRAKAQLLVSHPLVDVCSDDEEQLDTARTSSGTLSDVHLTLRWDFAGFTLAIPLLGSGRRRPSCTDASSSASRSSASSRSCSSSGSGSSSGSTPRCGGGQGPEGAALASLEVVGLQQMLVGRDPGILRRLEATGEAADAAFFTRWLIARRWDLEHAARDIAAHVEWRVGFMGAGSAAHQHKGPAGAAAAAAAAQEQHSAGGGEEERRVFLQGCDRWGRPLVVVKAGRHVLSIRDLPTTQRLICSALDQATAIADPSTNPLGRVCCLFDLSGLRARDLDAKALGAIMSLLQDHYPERLAALWFLDAPLLFWGVWRLASVFVQPRTREKIRFLGGAGARAALAEAVPAQVLPEEYGGRARLVSIKEVVAARRSVGPAAAAVGKEEGEGGIEERRARLRAAEAGQGQRGSQAGRWGWRAKLAGARRGLGGGARGAGRALAARVGRPAGRAAAAAGRLLQAAQRVGARAAGALPGGAPAPKGGDMGPGEAGQLEFEGENLIRAAFVCGFCAIAAASAAGVHSVAL